MSVDAPKFLPPSLKYAEAPFDVVQKRKEIILEHLANGFSVARAALAAGISTGMLSTYRKDDVEFDVDCMEAVEMGTDALEDLALSRAREGVDKPVFYQGEVCGSITEYSDTLLIFLLKARRPEKYSERTRLAVDNAGGPASVQFTFQTDGARTATTQPIEDGSFEEVQAP